ncbi:hypothetical protein KJ959_09140, partial [bacterium]|nr:hypothetical protein [bacterium]
GSLNRLRPPQRTLAFALCSLIKTGASGRRRLPLSMFYLHGTFGCICEAVERNPARPDGVQGDAIFFKFFEKSFDDFGGGGDRFRIMNCSFFSQFQLWLSKIQQFRCPFFYFCRIKFNISFHVQVYHKAIYLSKLSTVVS